MTDVYFIVLLAIGLLIFLFVVFLLRLNLCDSKLKLPEIKSYDFELDEITKAVHKTEELLLKLNGTETVTYEQTKRDLKICNDMLQDVRVTSTVIREEMRAHFNECSKSAVSVLYSDFVCDMLLQEKIEISDIPFEIRTSTNSFYGTACRACRNQGAEKYNAVIALLKEDLILVNPADQMRLARLCENLLYDNLKEIAKLVEENKNG